MKPPNPYVVFTLIIILPLVPAYVLYRYLPSKAIVSGPFKGWDVRLSGAFGGYFALVALAFVMLPRWNPEAPELEDEWTVTGTIQYAGGNAQNLIGETDILLVPPRSSETRDGHFIVNFKLPHGADRSSLPDLAVNVPGYNLFRMPLTGESSPYQKDKPEITFVGKRIEVAPITLTLSPTPAEAGGTPYNARSAITPQPVGGQPQ